MTSEAPNLKGENYCIPDTFKMRYLATSGGAAPLGGVPSGGGRPEGGTPCGRTPGREPSAA
jgi:hypothetical protein